MQGNGGLQLGEAELGGPHGETEWPQVLGPTGPQEVPTLGLGWTGALWGSRMPPHPGLWPLGPGRCRWGPHGLCEWQGTAESPGRVDGKAETQRLGPEPGGVSGAALVPVAPRCGRLSPDLWFPVPGARGSPPPPSPPHPTSHAAVPERWEGVSLELKPWGREGARSGADVSEIQCIRKRHECLILFY